MINDITILARRRITLWIFFVVSSSVKIPKELPTEYLQDKLLLSNQTTAKTTVREENTTKGDGTCTIE